MAESRGVLRKIHDATCPGAVADVKPVQKVCPVCRADAKQSTS
jgi:hypothetical protein